MGDYRPIALANFQFKVITKILRDWLAIITVRIISIEQRGFIRDRKISECVILAYEAINLLDKRQYSGNIALKVDIAKAFDTLDWIFCLRSLEGLGLMKCLWLGACWFCNQLGSLFLWIARLWVFSLVLVVLGKGIHCLLSFSILRKRGSVELYPWRLCRPYYPYDLLLWGFDSHSHFLRWWCYDFLYMNKA